jgi:hypothetical protein
MRTTAAPGQQVTCRDCLRTWTPTRGDGYYTDAAEASRPESTVSGRCFTCLLGRVMSLTGSPADSLDLSRRKP